MKKYLLVSLVLLVALCACNRKEFVNKLTGTWSISHYIYANQDQTTTFKDTTHVKYQFAIDGNQRYSMSWITYVFTADTFRIIDTISHDTVTNTYVIDTMYIPHVDTVVTPYITNGAWVLLNSQEDIQLTPDSDQNNPVQYQILKLSGNALNIKGGLAEYDLTK